MSECNEGFSIREIRFAADGLVLATMTKVTVAGCVLRLRIFILVFAISGEIGRRALPQRKSRAQGTHMGSSVARARPSRHWEVCADLTDELFELGDKKVALGEPSGERAPKLQARDARRC